jgi:hypothetical protein
VQNERRRQGRAKKGRPAGQASHHQVRPSVRSSGLLLLLKTNSLEQMRGEKEKGLSMNLDTGLEKSVRRRPEVRSFEVKSSTYRALMDKNFGERRCWPSIGTCSGASNNSLSLTVSAVGADLRTAVEGATSRMVSLQKAVSDMWHSLGPAALAALQRTAPEGGVPLKDADTSAGCATPRQSLQRETGDLCSTRYLLSHCE